MSSFENLARQIAGSSMRITLGSCHSPQRDRRGLVFLGYLLKQPVLYFMATHFGMAILSAEETTDQAVLIFQANTINDIIEEREQLEPFEETMRAFGVGSWHPDSEPCDGQEEDLVWIDEAKEP